MTKRRLVRLGVSGMIFVLVNALVAACAGITTAPAGTVQENLPIPTLVNNVPKPRDASLALQEYCGHLGVVNSDGTIETLRIPVYAAGNAPKLIVPAENAQADYHSLLDRGAAVTLTTAYGPASGNYALDTQDRLEVTQSTTAYCVGPNVDVDLTRTAIHQLDALDVDRAKVVVIGQATLSRMDVNLLRSITNNAKGAATPIVNFGGNNYSKNQTAKTSYFVSLVTTPVSRALSTPVGGVVSASPQPSVVGPVAEPPSVSGSIAAATNALPGARPTQTVVLSPAQFRASLSALTASPAISITRGGH